MTPTARRGARRRRLIFALDVASDSEALELVDLLKKEVGLFKVGKQLFLHAGPDIVRQIRERGGEVFLDLKFHDIPRTVARASAEAARLGVRMFDLHASGSVQMMRQTVFEVGRVCRSERRKKPIILAVTVLTSLNRDDLQYLGVKGTVETQVSRLAKLARLCGMDGVVASPHEVARIRKDCGSRFLIVTPGVRLPEGEVEDQKRVLTPEEAIRAGANYLVVGSPIRNAPDPAIAARAVVAAMQRGLRLPPRNSGPRKKAPVTPIRGRKKS
jgi:orotidine-5'-phosphate decarboxylase